MKVKLVIAFNSVAKRSVAHFTGTHKFVYFEKHFQLHLAEHLLTPQIARIMNFFPGPIFNKYS